MITYLEQLEHLAKAEGVSLEEACDAEGVARTTLLRWRKREAHPREATALALSDRIKMLGASKRDHGSDPEADRPAA